MESWVQSWRPRTNVFCDFYIPSVWSTAPAMKKWCPVMRSAAPVTQNHSSKPEDLMISNATPLRKAAPWPPDISDEHVFCTAPATRNASLPDPLQMFYACHRFWNATKPHALLTFGKMQNPLRLPRKSHIWTFKNDPSMWCFKHFDLDMCFAPQRRALFRHLNFQKYSEPGVLCAFWLGHVLRHSGVHFFDISTSKSGPSKMCFVHFDLQICFAPQRRALFRHLNFQKCSEAEVFFAFWLWNVVCAATARNLSSLIWPDGSTPAALASLLFDPPEPQIIGKTVFSFFFSSLLFSDSSHLCFSSVRIVGSLTSKLPSASGLW